MQNEFWVEKIELEKEHQKKLDTKVEQLKQ